MASKIVDVKVEKSVYGEDQYTAIFDDGGEDFLFGAFPWELRFSKEDLIGKTYAEAAAMFRKSMALEYGCY